MLFITGFIWIKERYEWHAISFVEIEGFESLTFSVWHGKSLNSTFSCIKWRTHITDNTQGFFTLPRSCLTRHSALLECIHCNFSYLSTSTLHSVPARIMTCQRMPMCSVFWHLSCHLVSCHILFHQVSPSQLWAASILLSTYCHL